MAKAKKKARRSKQESPTAQAESEGQSAVKARTKGGRSSKSSPSAITATRISTPACAPMPNTAISASHRRPAAWCRRTSSTSCRRSGRRTGDPALSRRQFQMIYVLKGWSNRVRGRRRAHTFDAGSCWIQPPKIKHTVLGYPDDCELLEIVLPADFERSCWGKRSILECGTPRGGSMSSSDRTRSAAPSMSLYWPLRSAHRRRTGRQAEAERRRHQIDQHVHDRPSRRARKRIERDHDRRARHRQRGDQRRHRAGDRDRHGDGIVDHGEPEILRHQRARAAGDVDRLEHRRSRSPRNTASAWACVRSAALIGDSETCAAASAGASLRPSPTISTRRPCAFSASITAILSAGFSPPCHCAMPSASRTGAPRRRGRRTGCAGRARARAAPARPRRRPAAVSG